MRLIDADALRDEVLHDNTYDNDTVNYYLGWIDDAPTIDAVPVVRCGGCMYYQDNNDGYPHEECRWGYGETPDADDYCSYGERKEEHRETD